MNLEQLERPAISNVEIHVPAAEFWVSDRHASASAVQLSPATNRHA
jgi:hypothetical protein